MITLYQLLADRFNVDGIDLSGLLTWNLDEYAADEHHAVGRDHPLSYWKYMHEGIHDKGEAGFLNAGKDPIAQKTSSAN